MSFMPCMRQALACLTLLLATAAAPGWAYTQSAAADTLRLDKALEMARRENPALRAARTAASAAAERVPAAGTLPDPVLSLGLVNRPLSGFGTGEPMTMNEAELTQMFPWPGRLGFERQRAAHLAAAGALEAREAEQQLAARVAGVYYELAYMDRALTVMAETRELLRDFFRVSQARYATGEGLQQDVLQAQVAVARMTEEIAVMEQNRRAMAARFNALLGREASAAVGPLVLPPAGDTLPPTDSLQARARRERPALAAAAERVEAAAAGYRAARRELYPDLMLSLGYGQRPRYDDMVSVMVGVSLPIWAGRRQLPLRREMAAMQAGEEAMAQDLVNETFATLTELRAEAMRARNLLELYRTSILPQARAAVESALSAYRVGRVEFQTLIESEMAVNRYRTETLRLTATWHQAAAQIAALLGSAGGTE